MSRHATKVRIRRLADAGGDADYLALTPAERFAMVWQLTLDAWAFKGEPVTEPKDKKNSS